MLYLALTLRGPGRGRPVALAGRNAHKAFLFAAAVMLLSSALFLLIRMYLLNVWADSLHIPFTSRVYGKFRSEIFAFSGKIALAWLISLPFGLVTAAALRFSVHGPTKKILREPVTEGLRKDTD